MPASHPGARPPTGMTNGARSIPARHNTHEITEFEFHISPDAELVAAPHRRRNRWEQVDHAAGTIEIELDPNGRDGEPLVGQDAVEPPPDLVAKQPEPAEPAMADGAVRHDTALFAVPVRSGRDLDDIATLGQVDQQCRVIQVAGSPSGHERRQPLEDPAVQPDDDVSRTERNPEQLERRVHDQVFRRTPRRVR